MKKIIYILFILSFIFGCSKQNNAVKSEKSVSIEEIKELKVEKVKDTLNFKKSEEVIEESYKIIFDEVEMNQNFNPKKIANQKIQQILDIALLIQKENIDFDLKNHALNYAKKLYVAKDEELLKEELNSINLTNIDSIQVKDLILLKEQKITNNKQNITLKFKLCLFNNGKVSILKKLVKLQIIKEETILNGQSYLNYKTKLIKLN